MFGLARKGDAPATGVLVDLPSRTEEIPLDVGPSGGRMAQEQTAQLEAFRQMVDSMPVNVMTLDLTDFTINYVNKTSFETLKPLEHLLPCKADQLVGQCFDIFHKAPSHQRALVSDPKNLPYHTKIQLGDEILDLLVSPIFDSSGKYVAPMLTWSVVTEKIKADEAMQRLRTMVENMPVNVMTLDLKDFTINYVNKTSVKTLKQLEHLLPCKADDLVGKCFDIFHKTPSHQRALVSDPKNLPYNTQIKLGSEILDLLVSPILDADGHYVAPMLTWSVVTEKVKADESMQRLQTMVDNMPINVMMAEPENLTLTYVNKTSVETLKPLQHLLPCRADDLLGKCIDIFHKHPEHQRRILSDPRNLPHHAKIKLGDDTLDLRVSAIMDANGKYLGPMVTWSVVTAFVQLADNFETDVKGVVETVTSAATEMQASAEALSATAEETNHQSTAVAAASEEATTNVQTVAAAAEELSNSIQEIGRQVSESTRIAADAVAEARQTNDKVKGLAEAAQKIGDVVNLINDIAGQTNLLALNATIEAARAGDAGKGFAVVATEVKSLADQTAKATDEIASQIGEIQNATRDAVSAIESIGGTIDKVSEISAEIAQAIEQQNAATHEIAQNVQQAAAGTQEVSSNITGVTEAAGETGRSAHQLLDAARELSQQANALKDQAERFLVEVRTM